MTECTSVPRCPCHLRHCLFQIEVQCFFLRRSRGLSGNTDRSWGSILATGPMPFSPLQRSNHPAWWKITLMMKNHPACWKIILKMENHPDDEKSPCMSANHPEDGKSPSWWKITLMMGNCPDEVGLTFWQICIGRPLRRCCQAMLTSRRVSTIALSYPGWALVS